MKFIVTAVIAALLAGCGGTQLDEGQLPSSQPTVACAVSKECQQFGASAKVCGESFIGSVMMSTWDNGKTWLRGNCDATAQ